MFGDVPAGSTSILYCSDTKLRPVKERDGRLDKTALRESPWRHVDDVRTSAFVQRKVEYLYFRGLYNS